MSDTLTSVLRKCATVLLDEQDAVSPDDVVRCAYRREPGVMAIEQERLVRNAAVKIVKDIMRELSGDDDRGHDRQPPLPGLDLPTAIAVPEGDDYVYIRADKATLAELEAGETIRVRNVDAAVAALDRYRQSVQRLRPFFSDERPTTRLAWEAWRAAQGGAA